MAKDKNPLHEGNLMPASNHLLAWLIGGLIVVIVGCTVFVVYTLNIQQASAEEPQTDANSLVKNTTIPANYFAGAKRNEKDIYLLPSTDTGTETGTGAEGNNLNSVPYPTNDTEKSSYNPRPKKRPSFIPPSAAEQSSNFADLQKNASVTEPKPAKKINPIERRAEIQAEIQAMLMRKRNKINAQRRTGSTWAVTEKALPLKAHKAVNKPMKAADFSEHGMEKSVSTFPVDLTRVITADRYIPCILTDQINSQLAGRVTCTIEKNIYGVHGRKILIPAGTRGVGRHGTLKKVGDERFNITWERLIRPDGVHIKTNSYSSDRVGATGVEGLINNRRWEKYGIAVLTATISTLARISIPPSDSTVVNSAIENYGTDLGRVTAAMLAETVNIQPYSIVPAGTRILITPTVDIWLKNTTNGAIFTPVDEKELQR